MEKDKLLQIADDLESGALAFDEFRFDRFRGEMKCGTVGCALGHYAMNSPHWTFDEKNNPHLVTNVALFTHPMSDASEYFDITEDMAYLMFVPDNHVQILPESLDHLPDDATPEEVAKRIRSVVQLYEEGYFDD